MPIHHGSFGGQPREPRPMTIGTEELHPDDEHAPVPPAEPTPVDEEALDPIFRNESS